MSDLAASIGGGLKASALASGMKAVAASMKKMAGESKLAKKAGEIMSNAGARVDQKLFDHGKLADQARDKAKSENTKNAGLKSEMSEAGDAAVKKFKTENASQLVGKNKSEQQKILNAERMKGMAAKGAELGLKTEEIKKLQEDKGLKYVGSNVFGAAYQAVKQARKGTLTSSLAEKDAKTKFSSGRAKEAMKNMSPEERKNFIESAKKGQIEVAKSRKAIARNVMQATGRATVAATKAAARGLKAGGSAAFSTTKAVALSPIKAAKGLVSGVQSIHRSRKAGTLLDDGIKYQQELGKKLGEKFESLGDSFDRKSSAAASKAGRAIGRGIDKTGAAISKAMEDSEEQKAAHQLEDEAVIPRMAGGKLGNALRSDRDKKAIRERAKANIAKKKISTTAGDADAVSELERESEYLDRVSEIDQSGDPDSYISGASKELRKAGAAISRTSSALSPIASKKSADARAKAKQDVAKGKKERVGEEIGEIDEDLKASEKREENAREARSDIVASPEYKQTNEALEEAREEIASLKDERKKMGRLSGHFDGRKRINKEKELAAKEKEKALSMKLEQQTLPVDTTINKEKASRAVLGEKKRSLEKVKESLPDDDTESGGDSGAAGAPADATTATGTPTEAADDGAPTAADSGPKMRMHDNPMFKPSSPPAAASALGDDSATEAEATADVVNAMGARAEPTTVARAPKKPHGESA